MILPERFEAKFCPCPMSGCWIWIGATTGNGYGIFWDSASQAKILAHRYSFQAFKGTIAEGLDIDHLCRNRACCNPDHLEPVSRIVNVLRSPRWWDKEFCIHGHEMTEPNRIYRKYNKYKTGYACRQCKRDYDKQFCREKRLRIREAKNAAQD